jgi:hypothetical protein
LCILPVIFRACLAVAAAGVLAAVLVSVFAKAATLMAARAAIKAIFKVFNEGSPVKRRSELGFRPEGGIHQKFIRSRPSHQPYRNRFEISSRRFQHSIKSLFALLRRNFSECGLGSETPSRPLSMEPRPMIRIGSVIKLGFGETNR